MKVGDLIKIKEFYKEAGRMGIVIGEARGFYKVLMFESRAVQLITPSAVEIVSESR